MYIAPSSGHSLLNSTVPFKWILMRFEVVFDVWSDNAALYKRLIATHSNPANYTMALKFFLSIRSGIYIKYACSYHFNK